MRNGNHNLLHYCRALQILENNDSFSKRCWVFLEIHWDHSIQFFSTVTAAKEGWNKHFFMEVFSITVWEIWKQRNGKIFRQATPSFETWKYCFIQTVKLQSHRMCIDLSFAISSRLQSL